MSDRNPVLPPDVCIPDGEAHLMPDGRLYVYGSLDQHDGVLCSRQYRVVSTADMNEWTVHDVAFSLDSTPGAPWPDDHANLGTVETLGRWTKRRHLAKTMWQLWRGGRWPSFVQMMQATQHVPGPLLFAPDCIERNGRYYLYFDLSDGSEGVAVSDRPEGPFGGPVRLPAAGIDPAVFIDDDGAAYYYWGQFRAGGVRLDDDMRGFDPSAVRHNLITAEEHHFHEGSSMRRIGDTYYLVFADDSRGKPTSLGYATGPSPLGPFTYRGIIIDNDGCDPNTWNNHGSIERVGDDWFVFYHRSSGNSSARRRLCVERIRIQPDGSIPEVPMTSQGVGSPHALGETIEAWRACRVDGGAFVGSVDRDEQLVLPGPGASGTFRYLASEEPITRVRVELDGPGVLQVRVGDHFVGAPVRAGSQDIGLGTVPSGTYEVVVTLVEGEGLNANALTFS